MNTILTVVQGTNQQVPVWLMRQAGRYMEEYMQVRKTVNNFLDLCYDPQKASAVTIQPITKFGFDCAIIFSDILVLPDAMGWDVEFQEGIGPILRQFLGNQDFQYLKQNPQNKLSRVYDAISIVRSTIPRHTSLIGFAGAPWTVVSYMLEGRGKQDFSKSKKFIYENPKLVKDLIDLITEATTEHLLGQIKAGCDAVQIFDSWAGILCENEYLELVIKPTKKIIANIKLEFPDIPIIAFPKGSGFLYDKYISETGADVIGVDQFIPLTKMRQWQEKIVVQGNLDPVILLTNKEVIRSKVNYIMSKMEKKNLIFNLGHGILPSTPVENVECLLESIRIHQN